MDYQQCWKEWVCNMNGLDIIIDGKTFDEMISFGESYTEAVEREYNIRKQESELLYMESSIDVDSYYYMLEECDRVFCEKMQKYTTTMVDKISCYTEKFKDKLKSLFHKEKPLTTMQKLKKALHMHPEIGKKEVKIFDRRAEMKKLDECKSGLIKEFMKQKSTKKYDKEPLIAYGKKYEEWKQQERKKEIKRSVTLLVAFGILNEAINRANTWLERDQEISRLKLDNINNPDPGMSGPFMRMYYESARAFFKYYDKFTAREQELNRETYESYKSNIGTIEAELNKLGINYNSGSNENIVHM